MSSLLLVEFAASDRFHRAVAFPFLHGLARRRGIASRWLRFGLRAAKSMDEQGLGIVIDDADKGRLLATAAGFRPRLVVFQPRPDRQLADALKAVSPGSELLCLEDDRQGGRSGTGHLAPGSITTQQLASRLAGKTVGNLFERAVPDFSFEPANELGARMPPLPFLLLGEECLYNRPFSRNSFLAGLDLGQCVRRGGCAFCTRPANRGGWHTNPLTLFRRQLQAITETLPLHPPRLELRLVGQSAWQHLEAICSHAARTCKIPLDLLVDCRADNFLRWRTRLKRALGRLRDSPHRLEMSLMGVENFSSAELHRLNKGLNPATNLAAIELLFALERDYGDNFGFRRHGGLSLITFTPWTRPADLALNLAVVEALGIEHLCGKLLTGRLRLYPELPLYSAARRDKLLAGRYVDPLLDTARANMYGRETPWRFQHPALEAINRLLLRLDASTGPPEDALARRLRRLAEQRRAAGIGRNQLALEIIDLALSIAGKEAADAQEIIGLLETRTPARKAELPPAAESWHECEERPTPGGRVPVTRQMLLAFKPVMKLEPLREADARRLQQSGELPNATLRRRGGGQRQEVFELFCGRRQTDVETAVRLAGDMDRASGKELRGMIRRMGRLLGYPRCCARAFSVTPPALLDDLFWLYVARRVAEPGPVHWQMNPAGNPLLEYVPCSLHCRDTRKRLAALSKKIRAGDGNWTERLEQMLKNPCLIFRGAQQGSFVELVAESQPGERFRYRAGARQGTGRLLEAVCQGDELVIEPECLIVLRRGRQRAVLSARAFLWWYRRAFQVEFWRALLRVLPLAKSSLTQQRTRARQAEAAGPRAAPRPSPAALRLASQLQRLREGQIAFAGYRLEKVECVGEDRVRAIFAGPGKPLVMDITPRRRGAPFYLAAGRFFLTYPLSHPLDTPTQERAARAFASRLANF